MMGSSDEERRAYGVPLEIGNREAPRHVVTIRYIFAIGRTEVTVMEYGRFVAETGRRETTPYCVSFDHAHDSWKPYSGLDWHHPGMSTSQDRPVTCVSWLDATAYTAWLSRKTGRHYRLPSEAEWEYAARGGTATPAPWRGGAEALCTQAAVMNHATFVALGRPASWRNRLMCSSTIPFTQPVADFPANPFGLYDMIGNVWEWTADCAQDNYAGAPDDGSAWIESGCRNRSIRGGAFHSAPYFGRSASRGFGKPQDYRSIAIGFRVVLDPTGETR